MAKVSGDSRAGSSHVVNNDLTAVSVAAPKRGPLTLTFGVWLLLFILVLCNSTILEADSKVTSKSNNF